MSKTIAGHKIGPTLAARYETGKSGCRECGETWAIGDLITGVGLAAILSGWVHFPPFLFENWLVCCCLSSV